MRKTMMAMMAMGAAACDGSGTAIDRGQVQPEDEIAVTPILGDDDLDPIEPPEDVFIVTPVDVHPYGEPEIFGDNQVCEMADTFAKGTVQGVVSRGAAPSGCFDDSLTDVGTFYRVRVGPHETASIDLHADRDPNDGGYMWLAAGPDCEAQPGDDWAACRGDWTWQHDGIVVANPHDEALQMIVAVVAEHSLVGTPFDLELSRDELAANASCETPLVVEGARVEGQRTSQAGIAGESAPVWRMLYYQVTVPPMSRLRAQIDFGDGTPGDVYPYFMNGCDPAQTIWSSQGEVSNTTDEPMQVLLGVGTNWSVTDEPFAIDFDATAISPLASCTAPAKLAVDEDTEVDLEAGGMGPSSCWCLLPTRSVFVDVEVPAGTTVELVGTVAGGDAVGRVDLVELDSSCASECGNNAAFGFDGTTVLPFTNEGSETVTKHVLVVGSAGWESVDNRAPTAGLRVRTQGTE